MTVVHCETRKDAGDGAVSSGASAVDGLANWASVCNERLRNVFQPQAASGNAGGTNVVMIPVALMGGILGATLLGALSYRKSAQRLARALPPAPPVTPHQHIPDIVHKSDVPKATEILTKGEIVKLFVLP